MKKTLILSLSLVLLLAVPALGIPVTARSSGHGAFGPHGIRTRLDFMLHMQSDGRDRLSLLLDLGAEAFDSAAPFDGPRLATLTLSMEPPGHDHDEARTRDATPESWTYEVVTPTSFKYMTREVRLRLTKRGKGFALDFSRATLDGLKEMLHHVEGTHVLYLAITHDHAPHADAVGPRHAHTLYEGALEVRLTRRGAVLTGRGTPTEDDEHHEEAEAF